MPDRPALWTIGVSTSHTPGVDALDPWPPADPLGEALHFLRMNGAFYCRSDLTEPWGLTLPPMPGYIWFHVVTSGRVWLETEEGHTEWVQPGELALVPHGKGHRLHSEPGSAAPPILDLPLEQVSDRYELLRYGGGGPRTILICGAVRFDHPAARNMVEILPPTIHIQASESPEIEWMQSTLRLMAAEAKELRPGGEAVMTRLADIVVIQAIRSWIETAPAARTGWLGALRDRQIGRAMALIHRNPARPWTVAALAQELAMSRSAFRRPLQRARRRTGDALRNPLAHATRPQRSQRGGRHCRRARTPTRLPLRSRLRPRLQTRDRRPARCRQTQAGPRRARGR
jgi:hypothetical protein